MLTDGQPVKFNQNWGYMVMLLCSSNQAGSRVLCWLEFRNVTFREARQGHYCNNLGEKQWVSVQSVLAAGMVRNLQMRLMRWIWKKADLQMEETWGLRDKLESKVTPRFLAVEDDEMESSPMVMVWGDG